MQDQKVSSSWYTIKTSNLVLLTFALAFFARVISAMGVPSVINFLHFLFVPILGVLALTKTKTKIWSQIAKEIFFGLFILLVLIFASALLNNAGVINVILEFCLLGEPFVLLLAMIGIPMSEASGKQFRFWIMLFAFINLFFCYFQYFILGLGSDFTKGVFLNQGAGHNIAGAVSFTASLYFFVTFRTLSIWIRTLGTVAFASNVILSDTRQVALVFVACSALLLLTKLNSVRQALQYLAIAIAAFGFLFWVQETFYPGMFEYYNQERIVEGLGVKFSVFSIIKSHYHSPLNWLFGLGPGHTIGRLGLMIPEYTEYLQPLGVTTTTVAEDVAVASEASYLTSVYSGSSMWSLLFSWVGVWGDLGFLGLGVYLYLGFLVWRKLCLNDISKFFMLNIFVLSAIFAWLEEPGYVLFVASLIGIQWQEHQMKQKVILSKLSRNNGLFEIT